MENTEQTQLTDEVVNENKNVQQPELSVADLQNLRTIIDVAVRRGAFAATEMSSVGAIFDRLNAFLVAVAPPPPASSETTPNQ